jgi:MFS family permease
MISGVQTEKKNVSSLIAIIIAGEAVFFLPFVLARIFRPTLLALFDISNSELGSYFSVYGIVAMISYIFGGTLADRFAARNLMSIALWLTSLGGVAMFFVPNTLFMKIIYGFWGLTTILLFWAAMIRATREWGDEDSQGKAFGWLEGGRGGTAALLGTISFFLFSWLTPESATVSQENDIHSLQIVIMVVSCIVFSTGLLVWFLVPVNSEKIKRNDFFVTAGYVIRLMKKPTIWMLSVMIVCAYVAYKITDDFSLYAREVLGFAEVKAAGVGTAALWMRAVVAVLAGYTADKFNRVSIIVWCYAITLAGGVLLGFGLLPPITGLLLMNMAITAVGIYGLRALYFAILREADISVALTGTAVGIVSFVGFTPDVFMSLWMGHLLDSSPGESGHQDVFLVLSSFALLGLLCSLLFKWYIRKNKSD